MSTHAHRRSVSLLFSGLVSASAFGCDVENLDAPSAQSELASEDLSASAEEIGDDEQNPEGIEARAGAGPSTDPSSIPSAAAIQIRPTGQADVGIIPQSTGRCPRGSEYVQIHTDDEDNNNGSYTTGWTGNIQREASGTTFGFCKVNGVNFKAGGPKYAVLSMSNQCPTGSFRTSWHFDTENSQTHNWASGNYTPSVVSDNVDLALCVFPESTNAPSFINHFVPYGVFTKGDFSLGTGQVHTDDEDSSSGQIQSGYGSGGDPAPIFVTDWGQARRNSNIFVAKVRDDSCTPCPYVGSYDGANCWIGSPPAGTSAFVYGGNFYYTPLSGNQCPRPGSWFDSQNCYVSTPPAGTYPFVYANMWYVESVCN